MDAASLCGQVTALLADKGLRRLDEPIELASGAMSDAFVDGKLALAEAADLLLAGRAVAALTGEAGIDVDAVGGLTMGADALAVAAAAALDCRWFLVRKAAKERGTGRLIEGARLGPGDRVLVLDDVITTGGSLLQAVDAVIGTGATVVAATTLLDRGDTAAGLLRDRGIAYLPIATYRELRIAPVVPPS